MKRFRWTRRSYRHARQLARMLSRFESLPGGDAPVIVRRYWDLWDRHRSLGDPLLRPLSQRYDPEIPF